MQLLVTEFDSLSDLKRHVHPEEPLFPATKKNVVPTRLLFRDEKYTSENVEILKETEKGANLYGNPQVINTHASALPSVMIHHRGASLSKQQTDLSLHKAGFVTHKQVGLS